MNINIVPYAHLPHPRPWPTGSQYDAALLEHGDSRNVADQYRYWTIDAIKSDMARRTSGLEIAIENLERDFNMGTIVRTANAFNVAIVHIIGKKQWNKRGAMVTDRYLNIVYHQSVIDFIQATKSRTIVAVDNTTGAVCLNDFALPEQCVLVFGSEGHGLSRHLIDSSEHVVQIEQFGSTRSLNVGVAAGIVMYAWMQQHCLTTTLTQS